MVLSLDVNGLYLLSLFQNSLTKKSHIWSIGWLCSLFPINNLGLEFHRSYYGSPLQRLIDQPIRKFENFHMLVSIKSYLNWSPKNFVEVLHSFWNTGQRSWNVWMLKPTWILCCIQFMFLQLLQSFHFLSKQNLL